MNTEESEELQFAEDVALYFERDAGMPRMNGRLIGWLLVCDPPEQTAAQLAEALQASKGSISSATRAMEMAGLVERIAKPGERKVYYRINDAGWSSSMLDRLIQMTRFLKILDRGQELMEGRTARQRARLDNVRDLYLWMQTEITPMLARYKERQQPDHEEEG